MFPVATADVGTTQPSANFEGVDVSVQSPEMALIGALVAVLLLIVGMFVVFKLDRRERRGQGRGERARDSKGA